MSKDGYQFAEEGGHISSITRKRDGGPIAIDVENQDFCDFLTWASMSGAFAGPLHPDLPIVLGEVRYFACENRFISACKETGITLVATIGSDGPRLQSERSSPAARYNSCWRGTSPANFKCVDQAVAWPDSDPESVDGIRSQASAFYVSPQLMGRLNQSLALRDTALHRLTTLTVERAFVYFDVSDYSKHSPGQQLLIVRRLQFLLSAKELWGSGPGASARAALEASMCTGDGFIFVFVYAVDATWFASTLANIIESENARRLGDVGLHFRCGIHFGRVYRFLETSPSGDRSNYIGEGINGGSRVLTAIGKEYDDVVYLSGAVREKLINLSGSAAADILPALHNRGRRADKHGQLWRVYELNHTELRNQ